MDTNGDTKILLLKDLCSRLPYGVKCNAFLKQIDGSLKSIFGKFKGYNGWADIGNNLVDIKTVKPYLRTISSMTEEEKKEFDKLMNLVEERCINAYGKGGYTLAFTELNDWLNAHHFDYRGLIEKGLALLAPPDMYKID